MGYNVNTTGIKFTIPADKLDAACQALKDLNKDPNADKSGSREGRPSFSWMPENYDETMHTAEEILKALGFQTWTENDGGLSLSGYADKTGDEDVFLEALAPFVPDGSYVNWEGEDGEHWQLWFEGGVMVQKAGSVVYV